MDYDNPAVLPYIDIPIQHASGAVLSAMNRTGDAEQLAGVFARLREEIPDMVLRTTGMAGFPGETEEEFAELCEFLQEVRIERVGVFEFSPEEGTEAAALPEQIDGGTKQARRLIVEELQSGVMDDFNFSRLHETLDVLCEGWDNEQELYFGRSYADSIEVDGTVYFSSEAPVGAGEFVRVRIDDSLGADLAGTRVG